MTLKEARKAANQILRHEANVLASFNDKLSRDEATPSRAMVAITREIERLRKIASVLAGEPQA